MSNGNLENKSDLFKEDLNQLVSRVDDWYLKQGNENLRTSWEMQKTISNYLVIGSGSGLAVLISLALAEQAAMEEIAIIVGGGMYLVCVVLSLLSIWLRSVAFGKLAVSQIGFAKDFEDHTRSLHKAYLDGKDFSKMPPPGPPYVPDWLFNCWEWLSAATALIWVGGSLVVGLTLIGTFS